jgi:hypothetical protein
VITIYNAPTQLITGGWLSTSDKIVIDAIIVGATGGVLDIVLQRNVAPNVWFDWVHFPQINAGGGVACNLTIDGGSRLNSITNLSNGTDSTSGSLGLPAGSFVDAIAGGPVRVVMNAGAGTTLGALQTLYFTAYDEIT